MTDGQPFYAPGHRHTIAPRTPQPGEEVWRLQGEGHVITCELRNDTRAGLGWDVQLIQDSELLFSKRCTDESWARFTAKCFRQDYVRTGFVE